MKKNYYNNETCFKITRFKTLKTEGKMEKWKRQIQRIKFQ